MTENIFANGGEFCMRGDPENKPVEWHWFKTCVGPADPIVYYADGHWRTCKLDGSWLGANNKPCPHDLIPIPKPPQIVPWESPDDVPDDIWIRCKRTHVMCRADGFQPDGVQVFRWRDWLELYQDYEYHTDRRAKNGWQPCGKVVQ